MSVCDHATCSRPAEYHLWGRYYSARGNFCYAHAREFTGCLCARCEAQSAFDKIPTATGPDEDDEDFSFIDVEAARRELGEDTGPGAGEPK